MGNTYTVDMINKRKTHVLGRILWDSVRFYHTAQSGVQLKTHELFTFGFFSFNLLFSMFNCKVVSKGWREKRTIVLRRL